MSKTIPFKTNNGFYDYQFSDPIFGFFMPLNFFVPKFPIELPKQFAENHHDCKKVETPFVNKQFTTRRMMPCNRVTRSFDNV